MNSNTGEHAGVRAHARNRFSHAGIVALALMAISSAGCRTEALIDSEPRGARVTVNGVEGVTPFTASLPITTFDQYHFTIEKEGYKSERGTLARQPNTGAILLSVFFPPALLGDVYRASSYTFIQLTPERRFPDDFAHVEPWRADLPPLPPGMTGPVRNRERATSRPLDTSK